MRKLFCDGWVFASHTDIGEKRWELQRWFLVDIVCFQTKDRYMLNAGTIQVPLWGRCNEDGIRDIRNRIAFATEALLHQLHADSRVDQLHEAFQCST